MVMIKDGEKAPNTVETFTSVAKELSENVFNGANVAVCVTTI